MSGDSATRVHFRRPLFRGAGGPNVFPANASSKKLSSKTRKPESFKRTPVKTRRVAQSYKRSLQCNKRTAFHFADRFSRKYVLSLLKCPACGSAFLRAVRDEIHCCRCKKVYAVINGMPNLAPDLSIHTKLEHIDYNSIHSIGENMRDAVFQRWNKVLNKTGVNSGKLLEIGSGTGQLTDGLLNRMDFESVHATDISAAFLTQTEHEFVHASSNKAYFYLCDANELPFKENSFDVVAGHSVLHHFLHYEDTLKACSRILKPGGKAIFFEPVIQGKVMVAMLLQMILETQKHTVEVFNEEEVRRIKRIVHHITKAKFIGDNKEKLATMEDKYIFDPIRIQARLPEIGFRSLGIERVGFLHKGFRQYVAENLRIAGVDPTKLKYFAYLFNSFGETVGSLLNQSTLFPPMVFLVFEK